MQIITSSKKLNFSEKNPVKIYTHHSIPLSIMLLDERLLQWIHEHYVQIFSYVDNENIFRIDYIEHFKHYREVMEITEIDHTRAGSIPDIEHFIVKAIDSDYYVTVHLDEYYLKNKGAYGHFHYIRQLVVKRLRQRERSV